MTELADIFAELGISHYLHDFIEQGFDTWDTILDITESDFDALGVKLGHRRKLQRKIANSRGLSSDRALQSPRHTPSDDRQPEEPKSGTKADGKEGAGVQGAKRKYRRHPKPDENAPERPPSAYVIFSNKMREELKGRNLSFTEIAKLVGENWQNLVPQEKEPYEQQAFTAKERYNNELVEYKKTDNYRDYSVYLAEFKARQSNQLQAAHDAEVAKRPKLEAKISTTTSGTCSSGTSQFGDTPMSRIRVESTSSNASPWHPPLSPPSTSMPKMNIPLAASTCHSPPHTSSPTVLPGYRESIFPGGHPGSHQTLVWRDNQREEANGSMPQLPRISSANDRRQSFPSSDPLNLTGSVQHAHRTGQGHPPPLLTSESTNIATTASSTYFAPRTPMERPLDRALPIPTHYNQKPGSFENQLPPLRAPSLSPQSAALGVQHSPNGILPMPEFPQNGMRTFTAGPSPPIQHNELSDSRMREYISASSAEDNSVALDPVSALLKAGEIVNRSSGRHHPRSNA